MNIEQAASAAVYERVRIPLTDAEILQRANQVVELLHEALRLKNQLKESSTEYRTRIRAAEAEMIHLTREIESRAAMVFSECDVVLNSPRPGQKSIIAKLTQEVIRVEAMTDAERQSALWP
jgi:hypothetical protein